MRKTHSGVRYFNDLILCDENQDEMEEKLEDWKKKLKNVKSKTEYLPFKRSSDNVKLKEYDGPAHAVLPQKTSFKYLGTTIHHKGGKPAVQEHIGRDWDKWKELT